MTAPTEPSGSESLGPDGVDAEAPRRLAVRVTRDALRRIREPHPWVYDRSITSVKGDGRPGDLAVVFDDRNRFAAIGLYDPASPIRVRILHQGAPAPIDEGFWRSVVAQAVERRARLASSTHTTGYRVVSGENDGLPGLVVDRYADVLVVKAYTAAWRPHLDAVLDPLVELLAPRSVVLRLARTAARSASGGWRDGVVLRGERVDGPVEFLEHDLRFEADVVHGQKTGHFLDQRENRLEVRSRSAGRRVLDVFSSSGGFSVNAAAGGASLVHSVDLNPHSIDAARRHMQLNRDRRAVAECRHETSTGDAMEVMRSLADARRRFDMVIVDPPAFATRKSQVDGALRAYGRLTELALALLEPGGTLVQASCSARVTAADLSTVVTEAASAAGMRLTNRRRTGHAEDHPVSFPEGEYLTALFARVEPSP